MFLSSVPRLSGLLLTLCKIAVEAVMTASSLSSLRAMQHKDSYGNVIGT